MKMIKYLVISFCFTLVSVSLLISCSTLNRHGLTKDALRERVTAYWDARVKGDVESAYNLVDPRARKTVSLATYVRRTSQFIIVDYEIKKISADPGAKTASVRVQRSFKINPGAPVPFRFDKILKQVDDMQWVQYKGKWYMSYGNMPPPVMNSTLR